MTSDLQRLPSDRGQTFAPGLISRAARMRAESLTGCSQQHLDTAAALVLESRRRITRVRMLRRRAMGTDT
jgi:hypothetical protein